MALVTVPGYTRKDGTKVKGYKRSAKTRRKPLSGKNHRGIAKNSRKGPSRTTVKRQMSELRGLIKNKRTTGVNRQKHKRRLASLEKKYTQTGLER